MVVRILIHWPMGRGPSVLFCQKIVLLSIQKVHLSNFPQLTVSMKLGLVFYISKQLVYGQITESRKKVTKTPLIKIFFF